MENRKLNGFNNGRDTTDGIGGRPGPFENQNTGHQFVGGVLSKNRNKKNTEKKVNKIVKITNMEKQEGNGVVVNTMSQEEKAILKTKLVAENAQLKLQYEIINDNINHLREQSTEIYNQMNENMYLYQQLSKEE